MFEPIVKRPVQTAFKVATKTAFQTQIETLNGNKEVVEAVVCTSVWIPIKLLIQLAFWRKFHTKRHIRGYLNLDYWFSLNSNSKN